MKLCDNANGFSLHWFNNEFVLFQKDSNEIIRLAAFTRLDKALHFSALHAICFQEFKVCPICRGKLNGHYWRKHE